MVTDGRNSVKPSNLEETKKNFALIENRLSTDTGAEFKSNLDIALSWLRYGMEPSISVAEALLIAREYAPNLAKILVARKWDILEDEVAPLMRCLLLIVDHLVGQMNGDENIHQALECLFNPKQPLYQKLMTLRVPKLPNSSSSSSSFMKTLVEGSCIDCCVNNQWQVGVIERFSDYRTEFEVSLDGAQLWFSIENDSSRIAPFGTKTGLTDDHIMETDVPVVTPAVSVIPGTITTTTSSTLSVSPYIGMLIDAQNSSGVWYQACVLDIKLLEREETPVAVTSAVELLPMDVEEVLDFTKDENQRPIDGETVKEEVAPTTESVEAIVETTPASVSLSPSTITWVQIAYIGLSSSSDEWISVESGRLAEWNSQSKGRRGDLRLRDEIYSLSLFCPTIVSAVEGAGGVGAKSHSHYGHCYANAFVPSEYVSLVNRFGEANGFLRLLKQLRDLIDQESHHNHTPTQVVLLCLPLVNTLGQMYRVLDRITLFRVLRELLPLSRKLFLELLSEQEIRHIPNELVEATLGWLDCIATRLLLTAQEQKLEGSVERSEEQVVQDSLEELRLSIAIHYFSSPFLNRRLGGLKMLTDMIQRARNGQLYPNGIQKTVPNVQSAGNSTTEARTLTWPLTTFSVLPITYFWSVKRIGEVLLQVNVFHQLYAEGSSTHDSLVQRSSAILRALAEEELLDRSLLSLLFQRQDLLKVLADLIHAFSPEKLEIVLSLCEKEMEEANSDNSSGVDNNSRGRNDGVFSVLCGIAHESRRCLMTFSSFSATSFASYLALHRHTLSSLWKWSLHHPTMDKLENLIDMGISQASAIEEGGWDCWVRQWQRLELLLQTALSALGSSVPEAILLAARVIQAFLYSWPTKKPLCLMKDEGLRSQDDKLPFLPVRYAVANYLSQHDNLYSLLTTSLLSLKTLSSTLPSPPLQQYEAILDLFYLLYRSTEKEALPKEALYVIWKAHILEAERVEEFDLATTLFSKLPTRIVVENQDSSTQSDNNANASSASANEETDGGALGEGSGDKLAKYKTFFGEPEIWLEIHQKLICSSQSIDTAIRSYLSSPFFSLKTLRMVEKWFKFVNAELSLCTLCDGNGVVIATDLSSLRGMDMFAFLLFVCSSEAVAISCVKFIIHWLQAASGGATDYGASYRDHLYSTCMKHLQYHSRKQKGEHDVPDIEEVPLSRVLLLFNGLVEEAFTRSETKLYAHGAICREEKTAFKITSSNKKLSAKFNAAKGSEDIIMRGNDTVEALVQAIAEVVGLSPEQLKIFRMGKEVLSRDYRKLLVELPYLSTKETLIIAERPITTTAVDTSKVEVVELEKDGEECRKREQTSNNVGVMTARSEDLYHLFFQLLEQALLNQQPEEVAALWQTLSLLPTFFSPLSRWVSLNFPVGHPVTLVDVEERFLGFSLRENGKRGGKLGEVVYTLQVVDILFSALHSHNLPLALLWQQYFVAGSNPPEELPSRDKWLSSFLSKGGFAFLANTFEWIRQLLYSRVKQIEEEGYSKPHDGIDAELLLQGMVLVNKIINNCLVIMDDKAKTVVEGDLVFSRWSSLYWTILLSALYMQKIFLFYQNYRDSNGTNQSETTGVVGVQKVFKGLQLEEVYRQTLDVSLDNLKYLATHHEEVLQEYNFLDELKGEGTNDSLPSGYEYLLHHCLTSDDSLKPIDTSNMVFLNWLVEALPNLLDHLLIKQTSASSSTLTPAIALRKHILEILLARRPSSATLYQTVQQKKQSALIPNGNIPSYATNMEKGRIGEKACEAIFAMVVRLLHPSHVAVCASVITSNAGIKDQQLNGENGKVWSGSEGLLSAEKRKILCEQILHEIEDLYAAVFSSHEGDLTTSASSLKKKRKRKFLNLEGNLSLLVALVQTTDDRYVWSLFNRDVVEFLVHRLLGIGLQKQERECLALLREDDVFARECVYGVLRVVSQRSCALSLRLHGLLQKSHSHLATPESVQHYLDRLQETQKEQTVGLRNLGATCYLNSLLQMLFMLPPLRTFFLQTLRFSRNGEEKDLNTSTGGFVNGGSPNLSTNFLFQLQKVFYYLAYSEKKSFTPTEFIDCLHCGNSDACGNNNACVIGGEIGGVDAGCGDGKDCIDDAEAEGGLRRSYYQIQEDACEYLLLLCEKMERAVQNYNESCRTAVNGSCGNVGVNEEQKIEDVFKRCFGGFLCHQMFLPSSSSSSREKEKDLREHVEAFNVLSLDVKGCSSLSQSLARFIAPEIIADYQWKDGEDKVDIVKRQCLILPTTPSSSQSDALERDHYVLFHLKRFELNFDTFVREKVNDYFAFPLTIDLYPYTKEGLTTTTPIDENEKENDLSPHLYYDLCGIIVHSGTSDSGHYLAYLKDLEQEKEVGTTDSAGRDRWLEYNDAEIRPFDIHRDLAEKCFGGARSGRGNAGSSGGKTSSADQTSTSASSQTYYEFDMTKQQFLPSATGTGGASSLSTKSAYILVYRKRVEHQQSSNYKLKCGEEEMSVEETPVSQAVSAPNVLNSGSETIYAAILAENAEHRLSRRLLQGGHLAFYHDLVRLLLLQLLPGSHSGDQLKRVSAGLVSEGVSFLFRHMLPAAAATSATRNDRVNPAGGVGGVRIHTEAFLETLLSFIEDQDQKLLHKYLEEENSICADNVVEEKETFVPGSPILPPPPPPSSSSSSPRAISVEVRSENVPFPPPPPTSPLHSSSIVASDQPVSLSRQTLAYLNAHFQELVLSPLLHYPPVTIEEHSATTSYPVSSTAGASFQRGNILVDTFARLVKLGWEVECMQWRDSHTTKRSRRRKSGEAFVGSASSSSSSVATQIDRREDKDGARALGSSWESYLVENLKQPAKLMDIKMGTLSTLYSNSNHAEVIALPDGMIGDDGMDADLALALQLSRESYIQPPPTTPSGSNKSGDVVASKGDGMISSVLLTNSLVQDMGSDVLRFLFEVTMDNRVASITEYWRKQGSYLLLLLALAEISSVFATLFIQRDLLSVGIDMILGEQSPLVNKLYSVGGNGGVRVGYCAYRKKRAPSSYLSLSSSANEDTLKHLPNWSPLLDLLLLLLQHCHLEGERIGQGNTGNNSSVMRKSSSTSDENITPPLAPVVELSEWDKVCLTSKAFYSVLVKQKRYTSRLVALLQRLSAGGGGGGGGGGSKITATKHPYATRSSLRASQSVNDNREESIQEVIYTIVAEVINEEVSSSPPEHLSHLFNLMDAFIGLQDGYAHRRINSLFAKVGDGGGFGNSRSGAGSVSTVATTAGGGLLETYRVYAQQGVKTNTVLVFIRSFLALFGRHSLLFQETICSSSATVTEWARWMARFLDHYILTAISTTSTNTAPNPTSSTQGSMEGTSAGLAATTSTTTSTTSGVASGNLIMVYGEEEEDERPTSWLQRAEKTMQLLTTVLLSWDIDVSTLLSSSTTAPVAYALPAITPSAPTSSNHNVHFGTVVNVDNSHRSTATGGSSGGGSAMQLMDGMTDEELEQFLASQSMY